MGIATEIRPIQGQLLRLSARRQVAIYLRGSRLWVADFIDGEGELIDPETWFRFNCASPETRQAQRRMLLESALPLSAEIAAKIEELHRADSGPMGKDCLSSKNQPAQVAVPERASPLEAPRQPSDEGALERQVGDGSQPNDC